MSSLQKLFLDIYSLSEKEIEKKFTCLGEGIGRRAFEIDDRFVLKLAKGKDGTHQNRVEHYVYTNVSSYLKKYLCPIVCYQPNLLIMKKADPLTNHLKSKYISISSLFSDKDAFKDLNYIADKYHLFYEDIISTSSWGKLNDTPILLDYGCTTPFGDLYYELLFFCS